MDLYRCRTTTSMWTNSIFLIILLCQVSPIAAQTPLTKGEKVKVHFQHRWRDGVIVHLDQDNAVVEMEINRAQQRMSFIRAHIRKPSEMEAIDLERSWESADGTSKVEAALKSFTDDKVVLAKANGRDVEVPDAKLSKKDQDYLKQFRKSFQEAARKGKVPALIPKLPPLETFDAGSEKDIATIIGQNEMEPLNALPKFLREFKQGGMGLYFTRREQHLAAVIPVGGPEQLVLVTSREDNASNNGLTFQSEAYWVSLKQQKILASVPISPEDFIVDYDPRSQLLVSVHRPSLFEQEKTHWVTVWNLKPGESEALPFVRWETPLTAQLEPLFLKLVNDHTLLVKSRKQTYQAWDFRQKRLLYAFKSGSFFDAAVVMTADRKHLLLPEDGKVTVLNAEDGRLKFSLPVNDHHVAGVNIDPSGNRLVCLTDSHVHVWDLKSSNLKPTSYLAPFIGSPFKARVEWINDDMILAGSQNNRTLFRLSSSLPIWSYRMDSDEFRLNESPLTSQVLNGLLFYVAMPERRSGSIAIGAVELPGPEVDERTKNVTTDSIMLLKKGARVGLKMHSVSDPAKVEKWLVEKIKANGWIYDPDAPTQIHAEMGIGKPTTERYRRDNAPDKAIEVTFTPHFANLTIKSGEAVVMRFGTSTGAPPIVLESDIQAAVTKAQFPPVEFFRLVTLPNEILDPKYSRGFGLSKLGLKGIEVESTSPPGRDADPLAPQKKGPDTDWNKNPNPNRTGK